MPLKPGKTRLDERLVALGLAPTRAKAKALCMAGSVRVGGRRVDKAGTLVAEDAEIALAEDANPYVSRGGLKLAGALEDLGVDPRGLVCLDVGASTGGFTDCLLQRGARAVYAVDVGRSRMDARIAADPRVARVEHCNARSLAPEMLLSRADLAAIDVSFISLRLVLPAVARCLAPGGRVLAMVKPQFEVGRGEVGKGGVVRDPAKIRAAADAVRAAGEALGLRCLGEAPARITGPKGNREAFLLFAAPLAGDE